MTKSKQWRLLLVDGGSGQHIKRVRMGRCMMAALFLLAALAARPPEINAQSDGHISEWRTYGADLANTRYKPFDQIDATNFNKLEVAWRFKTDNLGPRPEYMLEGTPLMVGGVLYTTAGTRRAVVALDAATGELLWIHSENEGQRGDASPRKISGRGLAYWSGGSESRIFYVTIGYRLLALDAKTGIPVRSFGEGGAVDLKQGIEFGTGQQIDLVKGQVGLNATAMVAKDEVIVGSAFAGGKPETHNNPKGLVRAFDVRTGKLIWTFRTIPKPGEFGNDTWLDGSWATNGNTGVWAQIAVDEGLGIAYLPVEEPTGDYYGGHRPGNGLFGESLVAVDLRTGQRIWHYQLVHHGMWDMDISSAPVLTDITVNGRAIKAVAQPTKQGTLYVFDRVTGKPVWPIEEKSVEKGTAPGEWYSPTQPIPTKPKAYARTGVSVDDFIDFTPALRNQALQATERYKIGPMFTPPVVDTDSQRGTLTLGTGGGGTNWPGGSYDPETHTFYVEACNACLIVIGLVKPKPGTSDLNYVWGSGEGGDDLKIQGMPLFKPPYGTITAINLDTGEFVWQIAHGETLDAVRNSPALKGLTIPRTGQPLHAGTLVTKTLVISGDPLTTAIPSHGPGAILHAYDKASGREVGAVYLPAPQSGSPMTYMLDGKQYIVLAVSGGTFSGEYIAFRLPKD
ncbi:MAG: PQQ-binding-like beta-propeller repeat protein [Candidatus Acidiferrales bacterium]|jgi:quinoprotein glucose dehydrogenase